jgi:hypothetical protein
MATLETFPSRTDLAGCGTASNANDLEEIAILPQNNAEIGRDQSSPIDARAGHVPFDPLAYE